MNREAAAIKTLYDLDYTYHGGVLWKPPISNLGIGRNKPELDDEEKERHIHADLINWWAECPSENKIEMESSARIWVDVNPPHWDITLVYRKKVYRKKPLSVDVDMESLADYIGEFPMSELVRKVVEWHFLQLEKGSK